MKAIDCEGDSHERANVSVAGHSDPPTLFLATLLGLDILYQFPGVKTLEFPYVFEVFSTTPSIRTFLLEFGVILYSI